MTVATSLLMHHTVPSHCYLHFKSIYMNFFAKFSKNYTKHIKRDSSPEINCFNLWSAKKLFTTNRSRDMTYDSKCSLGQAFMATSDWREKIVHIPQMSIHLSVTWTMGATRKPLELTNQKLNDRSQQAIVAAIPTIPEKLNSESNCNEL